MNTKSSKSKSKTKSEKKDSNKIIVGPFAQILTMRDLPASGAISDDYLEILENSYIVLEGEKIVETLSSEELEKNYKDAEGYFWYGINEPMVLMPGLIDTHTHICFAGSRAKDHAMRLEGKSYLEIAEAGGGILDTVRETRKASKEELMGLLLERASLLLERGVTTAEVKSGYGLTLEDEIKMLEAINDAPSILDLVPTCLAAHIIPPEFRSDDNSKEQKLKDQRSYLDHILKELLPKVKAHKLAKRIDIFIEEGAFSYEPALEFLKEARKMGFNITIHADQFSTDGSKLACEVAAVSADHLEVSSKEDLRKLAEHKVIATVLPGASLGLGINFAPAREAIDNDCELVIASDWNPGSAPMGDLLVEASLLAANEKLSNAETFRALTVNAAKALGLEDRGMVKKGLVADLIAFSTNDYREILYAQGGLKPTRVWKRGELCL